MVTLLAAHRLRQRVSGLPIVAGHDVRVERKPYADVRVAESLLHDVRIQAAGDHGRRRRMSQAVHADQEQLEVHSDLPELLRDLLRPHRFAIGIREHQVMLRPAGPHREPLFELL